MKITYQSKWYKPELVKKRYVKAIGADMYMFCEVGEDRRYDLRQGRVNSNELPLNIRFKADHEYSQAFGYVEWPLA